MKTLKITLLLLAVLLLTLSGQSSENVNEVADDAPAYKEYKAKKLLAHDRKKTKKVSNL